jgi:hypothetical protein
MNECETGNQNRDQSGGFRGPHVAGVEIRKIEPEQCKGKGKEEEKADPIVASELGPQLKSLPPRLRV